MNNSDITRLYCNRCNIDTNHGFLWTTIKTEEYESARDDSDWDGNPVYTRTRYSVASCLGCNSLQFAHEEEHNFHRSKLITEEFDPHPIEIHYQIPRTLQVQRPAREKPDWWPRLPDKEMVIFGHEIYGALHNNFLTLALMGVRRVIEKMMIHSVGDKGSFIKLIPEFVERENIGTRQEEGIRALVDLGNAATHRQVEMQNQYQSEEVFTLMETLLFHHYILPKHISNIENSIPLREKKPRPPKNTEKR